MSRALGVPAIAGRVMSAIAEQQAVREIR